METFIYVYKVLRWGILSRRSNVISTLLRCILFFTKLIPFDYNPYVEWNISGFQQAIFFCTKLSGTWSDGIKYSGHMWHFLFCFRYSLSVFTRSRVIFLHNYATCYSYDSPGKYYVFCLMKFNKETKFKTRKNTHIHRDLWRWLWAQCVECPHFRRPPPHKALCRNTVGCHSCQRSRCGWI